MNNGIAIKNFGYVGVNTFVAEDVSKYNVVVSPRSYMLEENKNTDMGF